MPKSLMVLAFIGSNRRRAGPNFKSICHQNRPLKNFHKEKRAKKKGAANNLIFHSRINAGLVRRTCVYAANRSGLYLRAAFCPFAEILVYYR